MSVSKDAYTEGMQQAMTALEELAVDQMRERGIDASRATIKSISRHQSRELDRRLPRRRNRKQILDYADGGAVDFWTANG